jgi:hypothetical protein
MSNVFEGKHKVKLLVSQLTGKLSPASISWIQIPQLRYCTA